METVISAPQSAIGRELVSPPAQTLATDNDLRRWMQLLFRRKWLIAGTATLSLASAALVVAQVTPTYRTSARIMLDTRKFTAVKTEAALSGLEASTAALQTELELFQSEDLLGRVVDKLNLGQHPEFNGTREPEGFEKFMGSVSQAIRSVTEQLIPRPRQATPPSQPRPPRIDDRDPRRRAAIGTLTGSVSATLKGRTYIIIVTAQTRNGELSALVANAIADMYLLDQLNSKYDANKRATQWLEERLTELRRAVQIAEEAVQTFRREKGMSGSPEGAVSTQTLTELNARYTAARGRRIEREARLVALRRAAGDPAGLANITEVQSNASLAALRSQEVELSRRVVELSERLGDNHPRLMQVRAELATVRGRFAVETQKVAIAIQAEVDAARSEEEALRVQVEAATARSDAAGQNEAGLKELEREAQSNRAVYESFLNRFKELREQQDIQRPDARILSYAQPSSVPASPQYSTVLMLALVVGGFVGIAWAIAIERLDKGFRSAVDLERATGFASLGLIPSVRRRALAKNQFFAEILDRPTSAAAEALRSVYTAVTLGNLDQRPRIIAVTSSVPNEGKTTVSTSLGAMLAKTNAARRVIVLDLDLRGATLRRVLPVSETGGTIDEYLLGNKALDQVIEHHESGVDFIAALPDTPNAPEILESQALRRLLSELGTKYDLVLLDSPPIMAVADARIIAALADYTICLVGWASTPREVVVHSVALLKGATRRVGLVLNKVDVRQHSLYGYGDSGYYYSRYKSYYGKGRRSSAKQ